MTAYWSWLLTAVGVTGLYFAGQKKPWAWLIGLGAQALWLAYAITTQQWGFVVSAFAYGWVYARNARLWMKPTAVNATFGNSVECDPCACGSFIFSLHAWGMGQKTAWRCAHCHSEVTGKQFTWLESHRHLGRWE